MTLSEFLRAQIAEDEAVATEASRHTFEPRAAPDGGTRWQWVCADDDTVIEPNPGLDEMVSHGDHFRVYLGSVQTFPYTASSGEGPTIMGSIEEMPSAPAIHIARHDPARVLAECEAKRRIVSRCDLVLLGRANGMFTEAQRIDAEDNLRSIALPYANRPDYLPEWAPDGV